MSQRLHQLQLTYRPEQDRLLLRLRTATANEFRVWLTRRFVAQAWPLLRQALSCDPEVTAQQDPESRDAVLAFEHERALSKVDFSQRYEDSPSSLPLGAEPILATRMDLRRGPGEAHAIAFHSPTGQSVQIRLQKGMLHAFCKLLQDAATQADWGLALQVVDLQPMDSAPQSRVLQ